MSKPPLLPNPENGSIENIEANIKASTDPLMRLRLQAIRMLILGVTPEVTAVSVVRTRATIRNWVKLWNDSGIDGMSQKRIPGRPRKMNAAYQSVVKQIAEHPVQLQQTHWTVKKLHGYLKRKLRLELGYSTLARNLREMGFRQIMPRPTAPQRDPQARGEFLDRLDKLLEDDTKEIWFADESGFLADPRNKRRLALKGTRPVCPQTGLHIRESVVGAVCPAIGEFTGLIFNRVDKKVFQYFVDYLAEVTDNRPITLILDNASWHRKESIHWHNITPMHLPAYSPDFNPIERLWQRIKDNFFNNWYTKEREVLVERISDALCQYMDDRDAIKSICRVKRNSFQE